MSSTHKLLFGGDLFRIIVTSVKVDELGGSHGHLGTAGGSGDAPWHPDLPPLAMLIKMPQESRQAHLIGL